MMDKTQWVLTRRTLSKAKLTKKRVLVCVDFNVPLKNGKIEDDARIVATLPTLRFILKQKPQQLILMSHLGRPKGIDPTYSLAPVVTRLSRLLHQDIALIHAGQEAPDTPIVMLENTRYHDGETKNATSLAKTFAVYGDVYVNDAFGIAHRKHASNSAITKLLPSYIGLVMEKELRMLSLVIHPKRPLHVVLGFAKIDDKLPMLKKMLSNADSVLLGGGIVFTFMRAMNLPTGNSLVEQAHIKTAHALLKRYKKKLVFPTDFVCAKTLESKKVITQEIPDHLSAYDIGPQSVQTFKKKLQEAKTVFWNGPLGVFEVPPYDTATNQIISILSKLDAVTIIGGGDTVSAVHKTRYASKLTHLSTGGGASLAFFEATLPAILAIYKTKH